jgi:hypothetical protein
VAKLCIKRGVEKWFWRTGWLRDLPGEDVESASVLIITLPHGAFPIRETRAGDVVRFRLPLPMSISCPSFNLSTAAGETQNPAVVKAAEQTGRVRSYRVARHGFWPSLPLPISEYDLPLGV